MGIPIRLPCSTHTWRKAFALDGFGGSHCRTRATARMSGYMGRFVLSKLFLLAFALIALLSSPALAAPACTSGTLASYITLGSGGCDLGSGTLSGFQTLAPITGALEIAPEEVIINPVQSGNMLGIDVMFNSTAASGQLRQALFGYMLMAPAITGSRISLSGTSGDGFATYIQNYCAGGTFSPGGVSGCMANEGALVVLNSGTDQATFGPVTQISVVDDFTLDAFGAQSVSGGMASDRFTVAAGAEPIPEPQTYVLMSSALIAIALGSRMRSRAGQSGSRGGQNENA